jgi:hypothetical protein
MLRIVHRSFNCFVPVLVLLGGVLLQPTASWAQQAESEPCARSASPQTSATTNPLASSKEPERPRIDGPLLLTIAGPVIGVLGLAIGAENRPRCTDGCTREIETPYLVVAGLGGAATLGGVVWLIERIVARSTFDRARERKHRTQARYRLDLQLTPGLASARLHFTF